MIFIERAYMNNAGRMARVENGLPIKLDPVECTCGKCGGTTTIVGFNEGSDEFAVTCDSGCSEVEYVPLSQLANGYDHYAAVMLPILSEALEEVLV